MAMTTVRGCCSANSCVDRLQHRHHRATPSPRNASQVQRSTSLGAVLTLLYLLRVVL